MLLSSPLMVNLFFMYRYVHLSWSLSEVVSIMAGRKQRGGKSPFKVRRVGEREVLSDKVMSTTNDPQRPQLSICGIRKEEEEERRALE